MLRCTSHELGLLNAQADQQSVSREALRLNYVEKF